MGEHHAHLCHLWNTSYFPSQAVAGGAISSRSIPKAWVPTTGSRKTSWEGVELPILETSPSKNGRRGHAAQCYLIFFAIDTISLAASYMPWAALAFTLSYLESDAFIPGLLISMPEAAVKTPAAIRPDSLAESLRSR